MLTSTTLVTGMCHHWEEVPIRELEPERESADEPDDVTKEVAPA